MTRPASSLGAAYRGDGVTEFLVWAPHATKVDVAINGDHARSMAALEGGYFGLAAPAAPGDRYWFVLDGAQRYPDPASRWQPDGVHGASAIVDPAFDWSDDGWRGIDLDACVFYELHTGTYTSEGTFEALIPRLPELRDLGITAIEVMPIVQFPGARNWGYDGVFPFAAQESYGGPDGFRRLVDACHRFGLAVTLDVVYNHLGPEGNYTAAFGPYETDAYRTPWGRAMNFAEAGSDDVRRFFIESALWWVRDCHVDALRVDAVHAIVDPTAAPFTRDLCAAIHDEAQRAGRNLHVIAESSLNDPRLLRVAAEDGIGFDALWNDDWHHSLHVALTGERDGYYADFAGARDLATAVRDGFVYAGKFSRFRGRRHGAPLRDVARRRLVVFAQNHDHVGNRADGARLSTLVDEARVRLGLAALLLGPNTPLVFMGEEYGETAPFLYFVSHSDPALIEAVRRGRREEFASFDWNGESPDPQSADTFHRSRINHDLKRRPDHAALLEYTRTLLALRERIASALGGTVDVTCDEAGEAVGVVMRSEPGSAALLLNFSGEPRQIEIARSAGTWRLALDSARRTSDAIAANTEQAWDDPQRLELAPLQALLFVRE